MEIKASLGSK